MYRQTPAIYAGCDASYYTQQKHATLEPSWAPVEEKVSLSECRAATHGENGLMFNGVSYHESSVLMNGCEQPPRDHLSAVSPAGHLFNFNSNGFIQTPKLYGISKSVSSPEVIQKMENWVNFFDGSIYPTPGFLTETHPCGSEHNVQLSYAAFNSERTSNDQPVPCDGLSGASAEGHSLLNYRINIAKDETVTNPQNQQLLFDGQQAERTFESIVKNSQSVVRTIKSEPSDLQDGLSDESRSNSLNAASVFHARNGPSFLQQQQQQRTVDSSSQQPAVETRLKCGECGRKFWDQTDLDRHIDRIHKKEKTFRCTQCDKTFALEKYLRKHVQRHTDSRPFKCQYCDKTFKQATDVQSHSRIHTGEKPLRCDFCSETFKWCHNLQRHMRHFHVPDEHFACRFCRKEFSRKERLREHERMHTGDNPIYTCDQCGKSFFKKCILTSHMRVHSLTKDYLCQDCPMAFRFAAALRQHVARRHLGVKLEKQFKCGECGDAFISKAHLIDHLNVHAGVKPFTCEVCGKSFTRALNLEQHLVIHSGIKPFKCHLCDKAFSWKSHLTAHLRTHAGLKPHRCQHCDKCFSQRSCLRLHMRSIHNMELPYKNGRMKASAVVSGKDSKHSSEY